MQKNENGRKYAIVYRPLRGDYVLGAGYDTNKGYWGQGYYDFETKESVVKYMFKRYGDENLDIYWEK